MMNFYWSILFAKVINSKSLENQTVIETYSLDSASVQTTEVQNHKQIISRS